MIFLVYGGSSSGKSEYAEKLAMSLGSAGRLYYIATMDSNGEEAQRRIEKHLLQRKGKGFITVERPNSILKSVEKIPDPESAVILLESVSTLLANEMFGCYPCEPDPATAEKLTSELSRLAKSVKHAVLVSDNIFEDGMEYDKYTTEYVRNLGIINTAVAREADEVIEVCAGIPVHIQQNNTFLMGNIQMGKNMFTLVIGGFAQGKLSFVREKYLPEESGSIILDENSENLSDPFSGQSIRPHSLIINHLHLIIKRQGSKEASLRWLHEIINLCSQKKIRLVIISDEVGSGVVPSEFDAIRYRENTGDVLKAIADIADQVIKVSCGIPIIIK